MEGHTIDSNLMTGCHLSEYPLFHHFFNKPPEKTSASEDIQCDKPVRLSTIQDSCLGIAPHQSIYVEDKENLSIECFLSEP